MTDNFLDNVVYANSTLSVSGNAVQIGDGQVGQKSIVFTNNNGAVHIAVDVTGNATINLPNANGGTFLTGINLSAGTTSNNLSAITFSNSNGVSFGLNNGIITATVVPGAAAGLAAAQAGNQTQTSGTLVFSNSNGVTFGMSESSVITASIEPAPNRSYIEIMNGERMTTCLAISESALSNRLMILPFWMDGFNLEPKTVRFLVSGLGNSSRSFGGTFKVALYSAANSTQLSFFGSDSQTYSITASQSSTVWNGFRAMDFTGITGTMTNEGRWAVALIINPISTNANYGSAVFYGGDNIPAFSGYFVGNTTSASNSQSQILPFWGGYNTTTTGFPNSIGLSQINGNNSASVRDVYCIIKQV